MRPINYLIIGTIISLLAVGFIINHMPLLGAILLIIGGSIGLKGRNILDKDDLSRGPKMTDKKKSRGVTIFALLSFLGFFVSILNALTLRNRLIAYETTHFILPNSYYYVVQTYHVISAILCLIAGIGLWKLLKWARIFYIATSILFFIYGIIFHLLYTRLYTIPYFIKTNRPTYLFYITPVIGFLWVLIIIYFFTRPKVKEQFK